MDAQVELQRPIREICGVGIEDVASAVKHSKESEEHNSTDGRNHDSVTSNVSKLLPEEIVAAVCHVNG